MDVALYASLTGDPCSVGVEFPPLLLLPTNFCQNRSQIRASSFDSESTLPDVK